MTCLILDPNRVVLAVWWDVADVAELEAKYGEQDGTIVQGDAYPGERWVDGKAVLPVKTLADLRLTASVTRMEFCLALAATDLLTHDEAIAAARGDWPAPMVEFLTFLDSEQSLDAQVEWASATTIHRMHPFVLSLGSWLVLTDTAVAALFGINT